MTGMVTVIRIRQLEQQLAQLGMQIAVPQRSYFGDSARTDMVGVIPLDQELPCYDRQTELFVGTLEDLEHWVKGLLWARDYDEKIGAGDWKRRHKYEQRIRQRQLIQMLKHQPTP